MTKPETGHLMGIIAEEHPKFLETPNPKMRFDLWCEAFEHVPHEIAEFAVKRMLIESPYTPKLADIAQRIKEIANAGHDDAVDAWAALSKAASRASIVTRDEYDSLPYEVKRFCGGLSGLVDLGNLDADIFNTVTRGQFMKIYENLRRQRETLEIMPPEIKALAQGSAKAMPPPKRPPQLPQHEPEPDSEPLEFRADQPERHDMTEAEWVARRASLLAQLEEATAMA